MKLTSTRPSPGLAVAFLALLVALTGSAIATTRPPSEPGATTAKKKRALTKKQVKQIKKVARKQANRRITKRAPKLNVASAKNADSADSATTADSATSANSANSAQNAASAQSAADADALGGLAPGAFQRTVRWARIGLAGGDPVIADSSGGMDILEGSDLTGHQEIDAGEDVSSSAILVTPIDDGGTTTAFVATACSLVPSQCNNDGSSVVRVVAVSEATGTPFTSPRPYYLAIID